jgi:hypothetical protein
MNRFTVIDEADELLSTGWEEAMEKLFAGSGMSKPLFCIYLNGYLQDHFHCYLLTIFQTKTTTQIIHT